MVSYGGTQEALCRNQWLPVETERECRLFFRPAVYTDEGNEVNRITGSTADFHHHDKEMKPKSLGGKPRDGIVNSTYVGCYRSEIRQVVVPCASNLPSLSINRPSAVPTRRPQDKTIPSALNRPVSGVMGRSIEILNSKVVELEPLSIIDRMARPMHVSRRVAVKPPCTVPSGLRCSLSDLEVTTTFPLAVC